MLHPDVAGIVHQEKASTVRRKHKAELGQIRPRHIPHHPGRLHPTGHRPGLTESRLHPCDPHPPYKKISSRSAHRLALRRVGIETVVSSAWSVVTNRGR